MSDKKSGRRRLRISQAEITILCMLAVLLLSFFTRCLVVRRTGVNSAAYLYLPAELAEFCLLFPAGTASALRRLSGRRAESGFYRNAKHLFNSAFLSVLVYCILAAVIWFLAASPLTGILPTGRLGLKPFLWFLPVLILDILTLLFQSYMEGISGGMGIGFSLLVKQTALFVLMFLFAGRLDEEGMRSAAMLKNEEVEYVYSSLNMIRLYIIAAGLGFAAMLFNWVSSSADRARRIAGDQNRKREDSERLLMSLAVPSALAFLAINLCFTAFLVLRIIMHPDDSILAGSYSWGIYSGIFRSLFLIPFCLVGILHLFSSREVALGLEQGDTHEIRIKFSGMLTDTALIAAFFCAVITGAAPALVRGLFGTDSAMAVRMVRLSGLSVFAMCLASATTFELMAIKRPLNAFVAGLAGLVPAVIIIFSTGSEGFWDIYSIIPASLAYFTVLAVFNFASLGRYLHLTPDLPKQLYGPLVCMVITGAVCFAAVALLMLILPAVIVLVIALLLCIALFTFLASALKCITSYTIKSLPLGRVIYRLLRMLRLMR
ncbi:MAG: hypothetical protein IKI75_09090 [Lachnospiraceae bacterium]|nr:hypothetical protein [Lachnospiraceae bacterium]